MRKKYNNDDLGFQAHTDKEIECISRNEAKKEIKNINTILYSLRLMKNKLNN